MARRDSGIDEEVVTMEELKAQAFDVLGSLSEEQMRLVLEYARGLRDGQGPLVVDLEELLDQPA
jgi:hypothetical protein